MCSVHHIKMVEMLDPPTIFCDFNIDIYYLLLIFSPFDDDLSQEKNYRDNHSYQPEPEGEMEMFHC